MSDAALKTYRGNCHCAAFVYEVDVPEFKSAGECNCSICTKKGVLWIYASPENFRVVKGSEDALTSYTFGTWSAAHKFCPACATPIMCVAPSAAPDRRLSLNARAIQGVDPWELELTPLDGASWGTPYEGAEYIGPEPQAEIENAKIYHGSCHCGAVTLAVKSKPLDKDYPGKVVECSCSICSMNGYIWLYTEPNQVAIQGVENLEKYSFGGGGLVKTFCKTCGVNISNEGAELSASEVSTLPEGIRNRWNFIAKNWRPVNLRVLNDYNIKDIKEPERSTNGASFEPRYVNP